MIPPLNRALTLVLGHADLGICWGTSPVRPHGAGDESAGQEETAQQTVARPEVENRVLRSERAILRKAAKCFTGETNW